MRPRSSRAWGASNLSDLQKPADFLCTGWGRGGGGVEGGGGGADLGPEDANDSAAVRGYDGTAGFARAMAGTSLPAHKASAQLSDISHWHHNQVTHAVQVCVSESAVLLVDQG